VKRHGDPLALPARELRPVLSDDRLEPVGKRRHPLVEAHPAEHLAELRVGGRRSREPHVLADGRVEEVRLLAGERERRADVLLPVLANVVPRERTR